MRKVSERKLKKARQDINNILQDLFKQERGLESIDPDVVVHLHSSDKVNRKVSKKLKASRNRGGTKYLSPTEPYYTSHFIIYLYDD